MKPIYLDNAATTRVAPEVLDAMLPYFSEHYGNSASEYRFSDGVRNVVEESRARIASFINANPFEVYFTSGGSESDNWAIKGAVELMKGRGNHIITSKIEHHAVLKTCEYLERKGFEVTYLDVDGQGMVNPKKVEEAIRPNTILISVMYANNEIGTVQQVKSIGRIARSHSVLFHTDAVQAFGHMPIDVKDCGIDLLSASAHKIGGPKGIGLLYIDGNVTLPCFLHGGDQESGMRAGTLNTPGIVGFAKAVELAERNLAKETRREADLRDYLINSVLNEVPESRLNGCRAFRLPNNANFSFAKVDGSALLYSLEEQGIFVSAGSACTAASKDTSHVLRAIGVPADYIHGTVRITLSGETSKEEMEHTVDVLKTIVKGLRNTPNVNR